MAYKRKEEDVPPDDGQKGKKMKVEPAVRVKEEVEVGSFSIHEGFESTTDISTSVTDGEENVPDLMDVDDDWEEPVEEENDYEQERARIMEENRTKLQMLGLLLPAESSPKRTRVRAANRKSGSELPLRRSGRVVIPLYVLPRARTSCKNSHHQTRKAAEGRVGRIHDPEFGRSCHQCRQKTLGPRTSCVKCKAGCGQFCTDCLRSRYGENMAEATSNKNWECPACRGICNCSICRHKLGLPPTGQIYHRAVEQGYKSVAHYLCKDKGDRPLFLKSASREEQGKDDDIEPATPSPEQRPPRGNPRRSESSMDSCSKREAHHFLRPVRRSLRLTSHRPFSQPENELSSVSECAGEVINSIVEDENTCTTLPVTKVNDKDSGAQRAMSVDLEEISTANDRACKKEVPREPIVRRLRKKNPINYKKFL
ncbi:cell division cycle-associated protein 7 [Marchantia polymorpha subsp. ruderalis]|uniref:RING-type domain-containing protein n=2 Tax=Marchantia polymorpha TaxID=3197 RepID=A0AAF6AQS9_MARPO|nr:hypothetical protein MARPO_0033s0025 [Marchantia polymorpha]BBM98799.1 hypothetical protein Mp_1g16350 [Marchantia polymorpha subsp. ruderalis]|eukprot:PTQ41604.1 hypothetical protein MARPO_0033s0025 [Marchantia polymorpha]